MIAKIAVADKFALIRDLWSPKIIAEVDGTHVKLARVHGEDFPWHAHAEEDELFYVLEGRLDIELRDGTVSLGPGELAVVPRGVEHRPVAREEVRLMLIERAGIRHTGDVEDRLTVHDYERI